MNLSELDNIKVFFILGRPRSGTTLLRTLLDAHSNINIPFEGRIISDLYYKYASVKIWNEKILLNFYNDIFKLNKIEIWDFNPKLKSNILELGKNATFERLVKLVYVNVDSLFVKNEILIIGDKNPHYSIRKSYLNIIKKVFPNAKIIHIVRDYRAQYYSMSKMDFENTQIGNIPYRWLYSYKIVKSTFGNSNNYFFLKHEYLTKNPKLVLMQVCEFLGVEFKPDMLEFYKFKEKVLAKYGNEVLKIHSSLLNPVTDKFNDKWKAVLTDKQVNCLDKYIGTGADEIGYKRVYNEEGKFLMKIYFKLFNYTYFAFANLLDYLPISLKQKF